MSGQIAPSSSSEIREFLRCNQVLVQHLDSSPPWFLCGLRWFLQCYYYCCPLEADYRVSTHQHDWFELALLYRGRVQYRTADHAATLEPGDVFFMPPGLKHSWASVKSPVVIASFQLRVAAMDKLGNEVLDALRAQVAVGSFKLRRCAALSRAHRAIWELSHGQPATPLLADKLRTHVQLFVQEFLERAVPERVFATPAKPPTITPDSIGASKYQQIVEFVQQNLAVPIQLEDIASHFHYSVRHVARVFRAGSGVALGQYILEQKLLAAQRLLATTNFPVKNIAFDLGYHDVGYFCRLFRTHLMGTPMGYRAQMLAGRTSPASHIRAAEFVRGPLRDVPENRVADHMH